MGVAKPLKRLDAENPPRIVEIGPQIIKYMEEAGLDTVSYTHLTKSY